MNTFALHKFIKNGAETFRNKSGKISNYKIF